MMLTLGELHDVTFEKIELLWARGDAVFYFQCYVDKKDTRFEMVIKGLTDLKVPRFFPWGPSTLINKAWEENSGEAVKLFIEMQSGDVIEVRAKNYLLKS